MRLRSFGGPDIIVNNAGMSRASKPTDRVTESEWDRVQAVDVKDVFFGTKYAVLHLRKAAGGTIINLSSIAGLVGVGGVSPIMP